jgi:tRNA dimethylallyltransferase
MKNKTKLIVIVGPTAVGKSDMAVQVARAFNGEVISADSRQVYKGLDIGSGKITRSEMKGVPHHLLDVISPKTRKAFTAADFQRLAQEKIEEISNRGKLPIICGGTGFYIQTLIDGTVFPEVLPNPKLRTLLAKKTLSQLQETLKKIDPARFKTIDQQNKVRLIRAIEIAKALGKVPKLKKTPGAYDPLLIGLTLDPEKLKEKIKKRLDKRFAHGMIKEVRNLHKLGVSWKRLESFGLEYRLISQFLQKKISRKEMTERLEIEIRQFAKRQMVWFKRDTRIKWCAPEEWPDIKNRISLFI